MAFAFEFQNTDFQWAQLLDAVVAEHAPAANSAAGKLNLEPLGELGDDAALHEWLASTATPAARVAPTPESAVAEPTVVDDEFLPIPDSPEPVAASSA